VWTVVRFAHLLAASIWIGGQITLFLAVPPIRRSLGDGSREVLRTVARRYGLVAGPSLLVLLVTGLMQADHLGIAVLDPGAGGDSRLVFEKLVLLLAMVALTGAHGVLGARIGRSASAAEAAALRRWSTRLTVLNLVLALTALWIAADLAT
jgi:uncharacterized membrane protein